MAALVTSLDEAALSLFDDFFFFFVLLALVSAVSGAATLPKALIWRRALELQGGERKEGTAVSHR